MTSRAAGCLGAAQLTAIATMLSLGFGCGRTPTAPLNCGGQSPSRTSLPYVRSAFAGCDGAGSDVTCIAQQMRADSVGKNATCSLSFDVTDITTWVSSDTAIATLASPGYFQVLAPGLFEITATVPIDNRLPFVQHESAFFSGLFTPVQTSRARALSS